MRQFKDFFHVGPNAATASHIGTAIGHIDAITYHTATATACAYSFEPAVTAHKNGNAILLLFEKLLAPIICVSIIGTGFEECFTREI